MARLPNGVKKIIRKDGRIVFRFGFSVNGKPYKVDRATPDAAYNDGMKKRVEAERGAYIRNNAITLKDYALEWLERKETGGTAGASLLNYRGVLKNHILPVLGAEKIQKFERREICNFLASIKKNKSVCIANSCKMVLSQIFKEAKTDGIRNDNPCENIPTMKDKGKKPARETIHRALTDEEISIFFNASRGSWYDGLLRFLLVTGLRAGEAAALTMRNVNFAEGVISIQRTATRDKDGKPILGKTTKTKKSRRKIPMNDESREILNAQIAFLYALRGRVLGLNDFIFPNTRGGMATETTIGGAVETTLNRIKKSGVEFEKIGVHALRDTFASQAIRNGMKPNTLKEILGHASLTMTMDLYAHEYDDTKKEAMEKVCVFRERKEKENESEKICKCD